MKIELITTPQDDWRHVAGLLSAAKKSIKKGRRERFHLDDAFILAFAGRQPEWGPVGYVTYKRTYARKLDASVAPRYRRLARAASIIGTEEFWLTIARVVEGTYEILRRHCRRHRLSWDARKAQQDAQEMFLLMWNFKFLPPGRGLWAMGTKIMWRLGSAPLNNCAFVTTAGASVGTFADTFAWLMDMSMLGVGVGFDAFGAEAGLMIVEPAVDTAGEHIVSDDREGWVDLVRRFLNAFVGVGSLPARIDVSNVRQKGAPIMGFGGTAAGSEPLLELCASLVDLLTGYVGRTLDEAGFGDVGTLIGRCVVAGNIRRSAEMFLGRVDSRSFMEFKNKDVNREACDNHRWATNYSPIVEVGQDYSFVDDAIHRSGETPGLAWLENARRRGRMGDPPNSMDALVQGFNPCAEMQLESAELCCLVETFPSRHDSLDEYKRTLKFAYLYGKTVTLLPTHDERTNAVLLRNRRIGTSQAGVTEAIERRGLREHLRWCDEGFRFIRELDEEYSSWLCVPTSKRRTSIKPGGTIPKLPGVRSGMQYPPAQFWFLTIRFSSDSPYLPELRRCGYRCVEHQNEPNTTVVYFPIKERTFNRGERDVPMWEQVALIALMQEYWADNAVSCTVKFWRTTEGPQITRALQAFEHRLKTISFQSHEGDGFENDHMPQQVATRAEVEAYAASLLPLDLSRLGREVEDKFCDGDACQLQPRTIDPTV